MDFTGIELGPKMLACSEQERAFAWHYVTNNDGDATKAARDAGYTDSGTGAIRVRAHALMHRERVLEAVEELSRKAFRGQLMIAVRANQKLLEDGKHPDHAKTVQSTLSRLGLTEKTSIDLNVGGSIEVNHTDQALNDLRTLMELQVPREKLVEVFGFSGLSRYEKMLAELDAKRPKLIEHEA